MAGNDEELIQLNPTPSPKEKERHTQNDKRSRKKRTVNQTNSYFPNRC